MPRDITTDNSVLYINAREAQAMQWGGKYVGMIVGLVLLWSSRGAAMQIDTTTSWDGATVAVGNFASPLLLGEPNFATIGQTFTVGAENVLHSFTFWLNDIDDSPTHFVGYVMAWDAPNDRATGPILYQSGARITTNPGAPFHVMERFMFNTGEVVLSPGQQYVAFLNTSNVFDNRADGSRVGSPNTSAYTGGEMVLLANGADFSKLTTFRWDHVDVNPAGHLVNGLDAAFQASFGVLAAPQPPVLDPHNPVPEPSTWLLLGTGLVGLLAYGWQRQ